MGKNGKVRGSLHSSGGTAPPSPLDPREWRGCALPLTARALRRSALGFTVWQILTSATVAVHWQDSGRERVPISGTAARYGLGRGPSR
jgi:hypothetical protein